MTQKRKTKQRSTRTMLRLPDLDHPKSSVLQSLGSAASKRTYAAAMEDFIPGIVQSPDLRLAGLSSSGTGTIWSLVGLRLQRST